jgi:hypothetical protein
MGSRRNVVAIVRRNVGDMVKRREQPALRSWAGSLLALSSCLGCSQILDIPSDPKVIPTGPWRCLQSPPASPIVAAAQAEVRVQACDFITDCTTPVTGLSAKLCDKRDVGCNNPRATGITDVGGELRFQVPTAGGGFDGYLQVLPPVASCTDAAIFGTSGSKLLCDLSPGCDRTAPDDRCIVPIFVPAMLFFNPPIVRNMDTPVPLQLFPGASLPAVIEAAGNIAIDPATGSIFIVALDCDGVPAPGVTFQIPQHQDSAAALYLNNGVVSSTIGHTDSSGVGGLIRVPAGFVQVIAVNSDSVPVGSIGVLAAPSLLTYSVLVPSPVR